MQTTLESFIYGEENYPRFFVFDWITKKAYFTFRRPDIKPIYFVKKVRDSHFGFVNLLLYGKPLDIQKRDCSLVNEFFQNQLDIENKENVKEPNKIIQNTAVLKSSLQKMIRRMETVLALRSAYTLLHIKPDIFFRRLIIIMIEDVCPHSFLTELCWYMMAYPAYQIDNNDIDFLLNMVYTLVECNKFIKFKNTNEPDWEIPKMIQQFKHFHKNNSNNSFQKDLTNKISLILSIYFREQYGGLEGDIKMLNNLKNLLFKEWFLETKNIDLNKNNFIKINNISKIHNDTLKNIGFQFLKLKEIHISSIDFHCCPQMIQFIHKKLNSHKNFPDFFIKQIMWRQSSSINNRRNYNKQLITQKQIYEKDLWENTIKPIWIEWLKLNGTQVISNYHT